MDLEVLLLRCLLLLGLSVLRRLWWVLLWLSLLQGLLQRLRLWRRRFERQQLECIFGLCRQCHRCCELKRAVTPVGTSRDWKGLANPGRPGSQAGQQKQLAATGGSGRQ